MSRTEVAKAREEIRKKLHARIEAFEKDKHTIEFHRFTPYKCPTFAAAAGSGMTCAGRNSLNRYLRATGFFGLEVETSRETEIFYSYVEEKPILSRSIMKLPVKVPGKHQLVFLCVPVLDENEQQRDFPIKLPEHILPRADGRTLYPEVRVPKSGKTFDLHPFPSEPDCYDEGQTVVYTKKERELSLSMKDLEKELATGIVYVVFRKLNGKERTLYGTTNKGFIPEEEHPKSDPDHEGSQQVGEDQVKMFDIDLQEWRSCRYSKISQVRVKLHTYNTFPGTFATREEYFESCRGSPF